MLEEDLFIGYMSRLLGEEVGHVCVYIYIELRHYLSSDGSEERRKDGTKEKRYSRVKSYPVILFA